MNSMLARCRRIAVLGASFSVLLVSLVVSASAQDLSVTKSTDSTVVAPNTDVSYQVSVSNFSDSEATGQTVLTDDIPSNMTFVSAVVAEGWNCTLPAVGSHDPIICTYEPNISTEAIFVFTFVFRVNAGVANDTVIVNTASVTNSSDPNEANNSSMASVTVGEPPPPPPPPLGSKDVLISEFRLSGPGGAEDDFIELYCNRDSNCDVSGATLRGYDPVEQGDFSMTFPLDVVIPARQYLLVADGRGYTLGGYGSPDLDVALSQPPPPPPPDPPPPPFYFYDNEGLQLVSGGDPVVIDSVGFTGGGNDFLYVEGTGLQRASSRPEDQYAYVRKRTMATAGLPQDTNNNAEDFVLVSVTGTAHAGITAPPVLGAPGPQGLSSPLTYSNSQVPGTLVDQTKSKEDDPNRVRVGSGDSGTMSLRRSFTNNTGEPFNYLSFRVIEITTLNGTGTFGENAAQLRLVSSESTSAEVPSRGGNVFIHGSVLEYDDACGCPEPKQPNGGGLNSTVFASSPEFFMQPGNTIDVQFLLNVIKSGLYRFYVYVEAGPIRGGIPGAPELSAGTPRSRSKPTTPRKFASARRLPSAGDTKKPNQRTPVMTPITTTSPGPLTVPANVPTPRFVIINRGLAEGDKKPRKKARVRRKNSAALKKKAEVRFAAEKPQN